MSNTARANAIALPSALVILGGALLTGLAILRAPALDAPGFWAHAIGGVLVAFAAAGVAARAYAGHPERAPGRALALAFLGLALAVTPHLPLGPEWRSAWVVPDTLVGALALAVGLYAASTGRRERLAARARQA